MNFTDFHFIRPFCLLAIIPYLVVLAFLIRSKLNQGNWSAVCDAELLPYLLAEKAVRQSRWPLIGGALAGLLAIIALAGPTWERLPAPAFRNDSALVILLDLSRSMQAADLKPNRLTMARYKISDILKQRKDGQTALIAYSGDAFTVTPLTTDTDTIDNQLAALTPDIMPSDGNNLSRALDKAVGLFKQAGLQKGQILLLTDGGELDEGISKAQLLGDYQLLVLSIGKADGAPIALPSGDFLKDGQGNIVIDKVDTAALVKLAQAGGGAYHALTPDDGDVNALLTTVSAKLQAQEGKDANLFLEQWNDNGPWFLLAVLPLAALCFRKGVLAILLLTFVPLPKPAYALDYSWQDLWHTKDQQAQRAYRQGDYTKAAELFENQEWKEYSRYQVDKQLSEGDMKEPETALGYYNQGTILAKSGESNYTKNELENAIKDYEKAIAKYAKALTKSPKENLKQDIKTNQDIVSKELERIKKELEKQKRENKQDQNQQNQDDNKDSKDQQSQNQQQNKDGKSSDQPEQQQDSQNKDQQNHDEKPEQKPEQSQEDLEKQARQKAEEDKQKQKEQEQQQAQAEQAKQDEKQAKDKPDGKQAQAMQTEMSKEEQQASEQWLKRIPDDPAGLLRRKFKYQYDRRGQQ